MKIKVVFFIETKYERFNYSSWLYTTVEAISFLLLLPCYWTNLIFALYRLLIDSLQSWDMDFDGRTCEFASDLFSINSSETTGDGMLSTQRSSASVKNKYPTCRTMDQFKKLDIHLIDEKNFSSYVSETTRSAVNITSLCNCFVLLGTLSNRALETFMRSQ